MPNPSGQPRAGSRRTSVRPSSRPAPLAQPPPGVRRRPASRRRESRRCHGEEPPALDAVADGGDRRAQGGEHEEDQQRVLHDRHPVEGGCRVAELARHLPAQPALPPLAPLVGAADWAEEPRSAAGAQGRGPTASRRRGQVLVQRGFRGPVGRRPTRGAKSRPAGPAVSAGTAGGTPRPQEAGVLATSEAGGMTARKLRSPHSRTKKIGQGSEKEQAEPSEPLARNRVLVGQPVCLPPGPCRRHPPSSARPLACRLSVFIPR